MHEKHNVSCALLFIALFWESWSPSVGHVEFKISIQHSAPRLGSAVWPCHGAALRANLERRFCFSRSISVL